MTADDVMLGLGLVVVLAVGGQLVASRVRMPAIVILLPLGFLAGIVTDDVHPDRLLGALYQPFVSLAVGVILFEAGLRLSFAGISPDLRRLVARLVLVGLLVTWAGVSITTALLFDGLGGHVALLIGAVLVVSGPTVVLPLLAFVRPAKRVRSLLLWEGVLIDPVGAILGVLVFHAAQGSGAGGASWPVEMIKSVAVGVAVGAAAAGILWLLLGEIQRTAPRQAVPAVFMMVVAALVGADLVRDDTGFLATTLMGAIMANQRRIDIAPLMEFHATLVRLLVGTLFILIAASVTPAEVEAVLPEALALVAVMAIVIRPLAVVLATWRSGFTLQERAFVAWLAPRGIVAGATASAFGLGLAEANVAGADRILPIAFVVIFATVVLYGLTAAPAARLLGVAGRGDTVLVVGGNRVAREVAAALQRAGADVRLWAGRAEDQAEARTAGLEAERGRLVVDAVSREAELEEVTDALLLTHYDDFNALAAAELRTELGHERVHRVAPDPGEGDLAPPAGEAGILAHEGLTFIELEESLAGGARVVAAGPGAGDAANTVVLFAVSPAGELRVMTRAARHHARPGDTVVVLDRNGTASPS